MYIYIDIFQHVMSIHVCKYSTTYVIYTCIYTYIYIFIYIYIYICIYVYIYINMYTCIHIYVPTAFFVVC